MSYKVVGSFSQIKNQKMLKLSEPKKNVKMYYSVLAVVSSIVAFSIIGDVVEASGHYNIIDGFLQTHTHESIVSVFKKSL